VNLQKNRPAHLWKPGQRENPAGRPPSFRQRVSERLLADLAEAWEHREAVLQFGTAANTLRRGSLLEPSSTQNRCPCRRSGRSISRFAGA
jgi:hypothetical protein